MKFWHIFVSVCLITAVATAAPFDPSPTRGDIREYSIDSRTPGTEEPPRIMDDTLTTWNFTQPDGWTFYDASNLAPQWHSDTVSGRGSDSAWWCGSKLFRGYGNYWYQVIQTPMLNLTGTTSPSLGCKLWYSVENVGTTGFDGVTLWISTNGGNTFSVVSNVSPAYSTTVLNAAGSNVWNLGAAIPGYCGESGGYRVVTANLSNFRRDSIVVRWSLLSDRGISSETRDTMRGAYLDSIRISDGALSIFSDNGNAAGSSMQTPWTRGFGQHWEWSNTSSSSAPTSAHCPDNFANQQSCLVSPPIDVPMRSTYLRFSVNCNMPDSVHTGSNLLRDFYQLEVQGPDSIWRWQTSDYMRAGHGGNGWYAYGPNDPYAGNISLNLSQYAGQTIRVRFKVITDYDIAPSGTGLWIDDVRIMGDPRPLYNVTPVEMHIPFPTTVGATWASQPYIRIVNAGRGQLTNVGWAIRLDSTWVEQAPIPVAWPDSSWTFPLTVPLTPGTLHPAVRVSMPTTPPTQSIMSLGNVTVQPGGVYELGYDSRFFWLSDTLQPTTPSYASKFTAIADGYAGSYNVRTVRFATRGAGGTVHAKLTTALGTRPNTVLAETDIVVPTVGDTIVQWNNWDLSGLSGAQGVSGTLFVVLERVTGQNFPTLAADSTWLGFNHHYTWSGGVATPVPANHDLAVRMVIEWPILSAPEQIGSVIPTEVALSASPNPFNPSTYLSVSIPKGGVSSVAIYDRTGKMVESLYQGYLSSGSYKFQWNGSRFASGIYFVRLSTDQHVRTEKVTLLK